MRKENIDTLDMAKLEADIFSSIDSDYFIFIDETGDKKFHKDISIYDSPSVFPVSTVTAVLISKESYLNITVPEIKKLKIKYFGDERVVLHSNDIRNKNKAFKVFINEELYSEFKKDIINIFEKSEISIISSSINKIKLLNKYLEYKSKGSEYNPGDLYIKNIEFLSERICHFLKSKKSKRGQLVFEAQGKKESNDIRTLFEDLRKDGSSYMNKDNFVSINKEILFFKKDDHISGVEVADYCVYPFSRHAKNNNDTNNILFSILKRFVYSGDYGSYGLKEWP